jgi:glucose-1-phosphate thymidylyltransferase
LSVVGVVPAAGTASRLQPFAGSKEAALVGGRPVIRYLLDRMVIGGVDRIRVVVRPAKTDLVDLVANLGHEIVPAQPRSVSASVLAGLDGLDPDDIVLLGFPDSVWQPADGFLAVGAEVERGADLALGLFRVDEPERSDVVQLSAAGLVEGIDVKPRQPRSDWIWGCLAGRVSVLGRLDAADELSDFVAREARRAAVPGVRLGRLIDIGTRRALAEADAHPVVKASAGSGR